MPLHRHNIIVLVAFALMPCHLHAQVDSTPAPAALTGGTLIRLTTGDSGSTDQKIQTARIDHMQGDSMILHLVSAGPVRNGALDRTVHVDFARVERSHTTAGLLVGLLAAGLIAATSHHGGDDGGLSSAGGFLLIPLGAVIGTSIKTVTWEPLPAARYTVIVGATGPGIGATIRQADRP